MCFLLYLGTEMRVQARPWDETARAVHTQEVTDHERVVLTHFKTRYVTYVGSNLRCGCGFRYAYLGDGDLSPYEVYGCIPEHDKDLEQEKEQQTNHEQLHDLLAELSPQGSIELYGCWDGEFDLPEREHKRLLLTELIDPLFYFHQRCRYKLASP